MDEPQDDGPSLDDILGIRHLDPGHRLNAILESMAAARGLEKPEAAVRPFYWNAEFFDLQKVKHFVEAPASRREDVLIQLSRGFLTESSFVERFGFSYTATLMLRSETIEEKSAFGMMAADETRHFRDITSFLDFDLGDAYKREPLILLLADVIQHGDRQSMIFLLQALLEGYGLFHYAHLQQGCNHPGFAACLQKILKDEGFHHATGVSLLDVKAMTPLTYEYLTDTIARLGQIVQRNNGVMIAMEQSLGHLTNDQQTRILKAIRYEEKMSMRMAKLKDLVYENAPPDLRKRLDRYNLFHALSPQEYTTGRNSA